jgi:hypothetical protein
MIPCENSSARKQRLGHISKQGSSLLRFLLVEAAQAAARVHPDWRRRCVHLAMRRHKSIAKVAMGRRLAVRLYWMWRNGCEYSPSFEFGSYAGAARSRKWREVERRPRDWASRSLRREFDPERLFVSQGLGISLWESASSNAQAPDFCRVLRKNSMGVPLAES